MPTHVTKPFVDVVDRVEVLEVEEGKKPKPVLFLKHLERGIVLNATRYDAMAEIAGSRDTDDWTGYEVEVRKGKTNYAGKPTGLRSSWRCRRRKRRQPLRLP